MIKTCVILATVRVYDSFGFIVPFLIMVKILFQKIRRRN